MKHYCSEKNELCEFAGLSGYCNQTACTKLYSVTYEAYGMKPLTNADYIRSMSDEELAKYLTDNTMYQPSAGSRKSWAGAYGNAYLQYHEAVLEWLDWLQQLRDDT
jgi:hypothetical protein